MVRGLHYCLAKSFKDEVGGVRKYNRDAGEGLWMGG
jgi:hypothetical protein